MKYPSLIIFDIDGTLADCEHRRHFITGDKKDWDSFYSDEEILKDKPIYPMLDIYDTLAEVIKSNVDWDFTCKGNTYHNVIAVSGRRESCRKATEQWFKKHYYDPPEEMYMRKDGDHRPDYIIKEEILKQLQADGQKVVLVFDDRNSVVQMWRRNGIICCQVAEGDF